MFRLTNGVLLLLLACAGAAHAQDKFPGIGRAATPAEIQAWDIDVRPDFMGLPKGSGSVVSGQKVWDEQCASCHGTFGESNEVFTPLVGGTTAGDIKTGRVKALQEPIPRTTFMKVSQISTLWDYINRAMPWNAPKSLSTDEVYAVLAYLLNLSDIVPSDFILSDKTIREVQERLPNRHGKRKYEGLWLVRGKGDVQNTACMMDCKIEIGLASALPDFAHGTHGNLAEQQRPVGATKPAGVVALATATTVSTFELARKSNCMACHQSDKRTIGPSFAEIAAKYKADAGAESRLMDKVKKGGGGIWGAIPMPPNALRDEDNRALVKWILSGAPEK